MAKERRGSAILKSGSREGQRGGIRTFAILGAILTVLVAGLVMWVVGR